MDKPAESKGTSPQATQRWGNKTIFVIIIVCLLFSGIMGGFWFMHHWRQMAEIGLANKVEMHGQFAMGGGGLRHFDGGEKTFDNPTDGTSRTVLTGVVTQVSASGFTIAGNGTTKTITATSNTSYVGKDKVAVNDSVMVRGTTNSNTFTADSVHIVNR